MPLRPPRPVLATGMEVVAVERWARPSPAAFEARCLEDPAAEPVVLLDTEVAKWPAMGWTLSGLRERVGSTQVHVRSRTNTAEYRAGQRYQIQRMPFAAYADKILEHSGDASSFYLAVRNLRTVFPELEADVGPMPCVHKVHAGPYLWIASKGHYEFAHFDPDDNFLIPVRGRKRVRMWAAADFARMYPNALGSMGRTVQFRVTGGPDGDVGGVDLERFPRCKGLRCWDVTVGPGEVLFIPAFVIHQVTAVDMAISLNLFFGNAGSHAYVAKILRAPKRRPFEHWLCNVLEQNKAIDRLDGPLAYLPRAMRAFMRKQFREDITADQADELVAMACRHLGLDWASMERAPDYELRRSVPLLKIRGLLFRDEKPQA